MSKTVLVAKHPLYSSSVLLMSVPGRTIDRTSY